MENEGDDAVANAVEQLLASAVFCDESVAVLRSLARILSRPRAEASVATWATAGGAEAAAALLAAARFEECDEERQGLAELLRGLGGVARSGPVGVRALGVDGLLEGLIRVLIESDDEAGLVRVASEIVARGSDDATVLERLVELHVMAVLMSRPTTVLISAVLPRLLRDERLCLEFCEHGGIAHLHRVLMFEHQTAQQLAGCVNVLNLLARSPGSIRVMIDEDGFLGSVISLLSNEAVTTKLRTGVMTVLLIFALDDRGMQLVEDALVPLIESLMVLLGMDDADSLELAVASFELMALVCNSASALEQVDAFGGEEFILYIVCFLSNEKLVVPLCSLLHLLCFGVYRDVIVAEMRRYLEETGFETIAVTLNLIGERTALPQKAVVSAVPPPLPPRKSSSADSKKARMAQKRANSLKELQSSERSYSLALFTLAKVFLPLLRNEMSAHELKVIFVNSEELYEMHKALMKKIDRDLKDVESAQVGSIFAEFSIAMQNPYLLYIRSNREALEMLESKTRSNKRVRQMIWEESQKILHGGSMSLEHYLRVPVHRAMRYAAMLREIEIATDSSSPDKPMLEEVTARLLDAVAAFEKLPSASPRKHVGGGTLLSSSLGKLPHLKMSIPTIALSSTSSSSSSSSSSSPPPSSSPPSSSGLGFVPKAMFNKVRSEPSDAIKLTKHRSGPSDNATSVPVARGPSSSPSPPQQLSPPSQRRSPRPDGTQSETLSRRKPATRAESPPPPLSKTVIPDAPSEAAQVVAKISSAYNVNEKVRIASTKGGTFPFSIHLSSQPDQVIGHGFARDGLFYFVDLEADEVLVMPVGELQKAKKKT